MNRKAAVAGQFYAGTKESLNQDLKTLFSKAEERKYDARAIISPHAGYVFSGEVAASAINQINPNKKYQKYLHYWFKSYKIFSWCIYL